ncbi:MAG: hypothetical protein FWC21_04035 [Treponema sp.]|nr:hypothetical protein [Treponema sp.]
MDITQTVPRNPNYDDIWIILKELAESNKELREDNKKLVESNKELAEGYKELKESNKSIKEGHKELKENNKEFWEGNKELREAQKETDRQMKETDRQIKEFNKRFGDFTNRFGEIVEYMVAPGLQKKFMEIGFNFQRVNNESKFTDSNRNFLFAVDIMLENSQNAMLVEVKSKLTTEDVSDHVERLEKMREYADSHNDKRIFYGAVAGAITPPNVKKFALSKGFFVVEPSGETFNITAPENKPREW